MIQNRQQQQPQLSPIKMYDHPSQITKKILSGVTFQYFIATIIMLVSLKTQVIINLICQTFSVLIYLAFVIFFLTVWGLKTNIGGRCWIVNFGLYLLMTASLTWSIVYQCKKYQVEEVLYLAAMLFASCLGLRIYASATKADFSDKFDKAGGLFGVSSGIALTITLMSRLYVSFDMNFLLTIVLCIALNLLLMKTTLMLISYYAQPELTSVFRLAGLLYWSLPYTLYQEVTKICGRDQ